MIFLCWESKSSRNQPCLECASTTLLASQVVQYWQVGMTRVISVEWNQQAGRKSMLKTFFPLTIALLLHVAFSIRCGATEIVGFIPISSGAEQRLHLALIDTERPRRRANAVVLNFTWLNRLQNEDARKMNSLLDAVTEDTFSSSRLLNAGKTPLSDLKQPILGTPDRFSELRRCYVVDHTAEEVHSAEQDGDKK